MSPNNLQLSHVGVQKKLRYMFCYFISDTSLVVWILLGSDGKMYLLLLANTYKSKFDIRANSIRCWIRLLFCIILETELMLHSSVLKNLRWGELFPIHLHILLRFHFWGLTSLKPKAWTVVTVNGRWLRSRAENIPVFACIMKMTLCLQSCLWLMKMNTCSCANSD